MPTILLARWSRPLQGVLRIVAGLVFLEHGTQKLLGFPHDPMFDNLKLVSLIGFAGCLEFAGGVLMTLGYQTRIVAFILSGEMAAAYFMAHLPRSFFPVLNMGEPAVLYCFIFLYLAAAGGGAFALDNRRS